MINKFIFILVDNTYVCRLVSIAEVICVNARSLPFCVDLRLVEILFTLDL